MHYNEFQAIKLAKQLMDEEDEDDDEEEDSPTSEKTTEAMQTNSDNVQTNTVPNDNVGTQV